MIEFFININSKLSRVDLNKSKKSMKKKRQIYMLIVIYSLITITTFAREITVCIANDHVGLKMTASICCDDNKENGTSINNSTDKCFECNDFPLLFLLILE